MFFSEIKRKYENAKGTSPSTEDHEHEEDELHSVIGLALLLGFVFMLLIDQIGTAKSRGKFHHASCCKNDIFPNDRDLILNKIFNPLCSGKVCHFQIKLCGFLYILRDSLINFRFSQKMVL